MAFRARLKTLIFSLLPTLFFLIAVEGALRVSDGLRGVKPGELPDPRNHLGYRDREVDERQLRGKKVIVVAGDSFAEGAGIADTRDRFSDRLQEKLGGAYRVLNVSRGGWDTRAEYVALKAYPFRPDTLILSYYLNDIDSVAMERGLSYWVGKPGDPPSFVRHFLQGIKRWSRLAALVARALPQEARRRYADYVGRAYRDPAIWKAHQADLDRIVAFAKEKRSPLIAVLFPILVDLELSEPILERLRGYFTKRGVPFVDVAALVRDLPVRERIVSIDDPHPSVLVHRRVAEALAAMLEQPVPHAGGLE